MNRDRKTVIFDLDGTLALIDDRRKLSTKPNCKLDWDIFFDPKNISLDKPNTPVITTAQLLHSQGFRIVIFSGRSKATYRTTRQWLIQNDVPFDDLQIKDDIFAVFDDRNQVVDMWRKNGLTTFQVAEGDF